MINNYFSCAGYHRDPDTSLWHVRVCPGMPAMSSALPLRQCSLLILGHAEFLVVAVRVNTLSYLVVALCHDLWVTTGFHRATRSLRFVQKKTGRSQVMKKHFVFESQDCWCRVVSFEILARQSIGLCCLGPNQPLSAQVILSPRAQCCIKRRLCNPCSRGAPGLACPAAQH